MKDWTLETKFLYGDAKEGEWTGGIISSVESKKTNQFGKLFLLLNLKAPSGFDTSVAGDLLIENLQDTYFDLEDEEINIIKRLEKSILSAAKRLEILLEREKVASQKGIDMAVTAVVVRDNYIYMALLGEGGIFLIRNSSLIGITEGLKDLSGRELIRSGSGELKANDSFILLTPKALLDMGETELRISVDNGNLDNVIQKKSHAAFGIILLQCCSELKEDVSIPKEETEERKDQDEKTDTHYIKTKQEDVSVNEESAEDVSEDIGKESEEPMDHEDISNNTLDKKEVAGEYLTSQKERRVSEDEVGSKKDGFTSKIQQKISDKRTYQVLLHKGKHNIMIFLRFIKKYIWGKIFGMEGRDIYIKGSGPKRSLRGIIILILIVASLLFISIRTISRNKEKDEQTQEVEQILKSVDEEYDNGRSLGSVGNVASSIAVVNDAIKQLEDAKQYGVLLDEINMRLEEGVKILDEVRKVIIITEDNRITDIAGFIDDTEASDMIITQGNIYITDAKNASLYKTDIDGGDVSIAFSEENGIASPYTLTNDNEGNILVVDHEKGVLYINVSNNTVQEIAGLSITSVGTVTNCEYYISPDNAEFFYLLRPEKNDVQKISKYPSGYSLPALRLADSRFSDAVDMEIDGKIYILLKTGTILRYFGDNIDNYTLTGLDKPIGSTTMALELDDTLVYIGDSENNRVVVVTKGSTVTPEKGKFVAQIEYRGEGEALGDIQEIVVENQSRMMYILDDTKIFKVSLSKVDEYKINLE